MSWLITVVVILIVVATIAALRAKQKETTGTDDFPYVQAGPLFTPAERSFLGVLQTAVGEDAQVFGKVRVADVLMPGKGLTRSDWQKAFNRIKAKHFDFIVCKRDDLSVICAVELNDSSHETKNRKQRDELLGIACNVAKLPLIQVEAKSGYVVADVRRLLSPYMGADTTTEIKPATIIEDDVTRFTNPDTVPGAGACPQCASPLVKRTATKGKHAGKEFMGCSSFPKCRHSQAIDA